MDDLPSTEISYDLRRLVIENNKDFETLHRLRAQVESILKEPKEKRLMSTSGDSFYSAWEFFSTLAPENSFYLPPLYRSRHLDILLKSGIEGLLMREAGVIYGCSNNIGHLVLGGVEGAGKTTLLRAFLLPFYRK
jgi:hypothetical protein